MRGGRVHRRARRVRRAPPSRTCASSRRRRRRRRGGTARSVLVPRRPVGPEPASAPSGGGVAGSPAGAGRASMRVRPGLRPRGFDRANERRQRCRRGFRWFLAGYVRRGMGGAHDVARAVWGKRGERVFSRFVSQVVEGPSPPRRFRVHRGSHQRLALRQVPRAVQARVRPRERLRRGSDRRSEQAGQTGFQRRGPNRGPRHE